MNNQYVCLDGLEEYYFSNLYSIKDKRKTFKETYLDIYPVRYYFHTMFGG